VGQQVQQQSVDKDAPPAVARSDRGSDQDLDADRRSKDRQI
jgi:hypothetical protein